MTIFAVKGSLFALTDDVLTSDFSLDTAVLSEVGFTDSGPTKQLKKWAIAPPTSWSKVSLKTPCNAQMDQGQLQTPKCQLQEPEIQEFAITKDASPENVSTEFDKLLDDKPWERV